jgi:hypothetical protein
MKKVFCALLLAASLGSCGVDNSSSVQVALDGNGCLIQASNFDWFEESTTGTERTVNYRWECADHTSLRTGESVEAKRVTLTFIGASCLQLSAEVIGAGFCTDTKLQLN